MISLDTFAEEKFSIKIISRTIESCRNIAQRNRNDEGLAIKVTCTTIHFRSSYASSVRDSHSRDYISEQATLPPLSLSEKRSLAIEERRGRCNDRDPCVYLTSKIAAAFKVRPCTLHYAFVHGQDAHMRAACAFKPRTDPRRPFIFLQLFSREPFLYRPRVG